MIKAMWNGVVVAESEKTEIVDGNHYFPADSIHKQYFKKSDTTSVCPWKGTADYYSIEVDGKINEDAVWVYPTPKEAAINLQDRYAFWKGVVVTD
jgi:uncharacterized protein (DUF427 family)